MEFTGTMVHQGCSPLFARARGRTSGLVGALGWRVALLVAVMLFILLPLAATEIPPLQDYPNHLARIHILSGLKNHELALFIHPVKDGWRDANLAVEPSC